MVWSIKIKMHTPPSRLPFESTKGRERLNEGDVVCLRAPAHEVKISRLQAEIFLFEVLTTTQAPEAKTAKPTLVTSRAIDNDLEETLDRLTKRAPIAREEETRALTMRTGASRQAVLHTNEMLEGILSFLPRCYCQLSWAP